MIGEYINCPLLVTKSGQSTFTYNATVDFGDGFVQSIIIHDKNSSNGQPFIAPFSHRYNESGNYSINFSISALKINWAVEENLQIYGISKRLTFQN